MDHFLRQRGRALIDFEVGVRRAANRMHMAVEGILAAKGALAETLPQDMDARHAFVDDVLAGALVYQARALFGEWSACQHGQVCEAAFEEICDDIAPMLDALADGTTTIEEFPQFVPPRYWSEVWFHRTTGGWDAGPYSGFVHGELVHKRYVSRIFPGDIYAQRRTVLDELPRHDHARILEFGTSSGHYTVALSERFPRAMIVGIDPSIRMLEQARRVGNALGQAWQLRVGVGEDSGLPDESFDLVTSYAIHHELPPQIIARWFAEAFRLLEPGGDLLMVDVPRYADLDRLVAWRFDWAAKWGGEPFWRASAQLDLAEGARAAGFVDVHAGGIAPAGNPYVVYGRKPEQAHG
ncbi:Ubiquinone/menaquinone biosynthesis C-methylase UbiE [Sphingomonas sp. YR710]|uniref:class I SAM-dependent methyltransferase n=1 Tax=Sphingomonas sp. YR710 TaxID=1882773 RepID=UPI00088120B0|nr:class I SAM-dependent methyltransferase [Sphingomonas sp. YR710]SDC83824.1 Ubiquinone/menaquinone biosynthesis C-methylase UbiE [Sphingomonas sp. YR710]